MTPNPQSEVKCCRDCRVLHESKTGNDYISCRNVDCPCHQVSHPESWESEIYAKWKAEHGDVAHGAIGNIPPEWWVRNYVDTRLIPALRSLIERERAEGYKEGFDKACALYQLEPKK